MSELLGAMTLVLSAWAWLFLIFTGLGFFIRRSFGLRIQCAESWLTSFWIGWAFVILILQLWHFQFRVDWRVLVFVSMIGAAGLLWNWKDLWYLIRKRVPQKWFFLFALLLTTTWLANRAIGPQIIYDSGLYHLNSVRWVESYPIVPGLGNLHGRLAFNSSYFLYAAMLEIGPWADKSRHLANGLLLLALFTQILLSGFKLFRGNSKKVYHLFNILLLAPILKQALGPHISSPSPDFPIFALGIVLSAQLLAFLANSERSGKEDGYAVFFITALAVVGITIKLSFAVLGGAVALLAFVVWFTRSGSRNRFDGNRTLIWIIICVAMVLLPWMIRGIILSGYIAYPSAVGSFPVEWRMPRESVVSEANWIRSWARTPGVHWSKVLGNWDWFNPWAFRMLGCFDIIISLVLTLVACCLTLSYRLTKKHERKTQGAQWLFLLPPIVSLVFWFVTAPAPRFAGACFWVLGAGAIALTVDMLNQPKRTAILCIILCILIIGIITNNLIVGKMNFVRAVIGEKNLMKGFRQLNINRAALVVGPGQDHGFYATPSVDLKTVETRSGLAIYVPQKGDQCWDAPLPCTPYPNVNLRLRHEGDIRGGFILDSDDDVSHNIGNISKSL